MSASSSGSGRRPKKSTRAKLDRIKRPERRLLERAEGARLTESADPLGRAALFTHGQQGQGTSTAVHVHCSRCEATTPVGVGTAVRALAPLFLFAPWRDHPVFAVCPACRHRAWLRPVSGE